MEREREKERERGRQREREREKKHVDERNFIIMGSPSQNCRVGSLSQIDMAASVCF